MAKASKASTQAKPKATKGKSKAVKGKAMGAAAKPPKQGKADTKTPAKMGRPTAYRPEYVKAAYELCILGYTDKLLAEYFEVSEVTLNEWKKVHPDFLASIRSGKEQADSKVAEAVYRRACGFSVVEKKSVLVEGVPVPVDQERYFPPDTAAAIFWLKNRHPHLWKDRVEVDQRTTLEAPASEVLGEFYAQQVAVMAERTQAVMERVKRLSSE